MRPLIVVTGQGIAKADGFDLTRRLRDVEELAECFERGRPYPDDLDFVFSACGRAGDRLLDLLIDRTRKVCLAARSATSEMVKQRRLLTFLAEEGQSRAVVHFTTNIDGITSTIASGECGAFWRPFNDIATIDDLINDLRGVFDAGRGFVHLPLHGEAGLVSLSDGAETLRTVGLDTPLPRPVASTLYEGLGLDVVSIERRMAFSQLGYRLLLEAQLGGEVRLDRGQRVGRFPPSDVVAVGYGAGVSDRRSQYPFEAKICFAHAARAPERPGSRTALLYDGADNRLTQSWYSKHGFDCVPHGRTDLVEVLRAVALPD